MSALSRHLLHTLFYFIGSVIAAYLLVQSGVVHSFLSATDGLEQVSSLVAGIFFTSIFTTAPAMVVLAELAESTSLWTVAIFGGFGAVLGDFLLFWVIRERLSPEVEFLLKHTPSSRRFKKIFNTKLFHQLLPFLGAIVLASPLPDELGLAMLGFSHMKKERFLLISFVMNVLGIVAIGLVARSIGG